MKTRSLMIRAALLFVTAISLLALSACSTTETKNPGPHQGSGTSDGKDGGYRTMGARRAAAGQPVESVEANEFVKDSVNHVKIQLHNPGPHQISITAQDPVDEGNPAASKAGRKKQVTAHIRLEQYTGDHHRFNVTHCPKEDE